MDRDLKRLVCGVPDDESELGEALNQIGMSLSAVIDGLMAVKDSNHISFFGPFLGRSILELGCTAVLARIDPFRILMLREVQKQSDYQVGKQNKASIQWQGDILAEKVKDGLWKDKNIVKPTRALLGDYYEHIFWKNAIEKLLDNVPTGRGGEWLARIRNIGSEGFCSNIRRELRRLYSTLSKGIHHEFVISTESIFDRSTISNLIQDSFYIIASLGLAINSVSHIPFRISFEKSLDYYENFQKAEII
ncbi:hypothetical protein [Desulfonema magnum]|uniref:Uncharacterized protein n=1 Tax=Desulfonema magnum TaxID=45655 RepID=A0A975BP67_9BACT|nr:hypothetical protein [Desulfonema magnum]QTA88540.1 Uncharacterized protein dnm_045860 [Desulfonema magnum]